MRGIYTYKITLSNTTSTATSPNLQVRLNINFASLVSNINADLGNIRFSSDQAGNNLLYAWLESAPQGTFTQGSSVSTYISSNVWVNLGNNIIPANGSLTIYMQILSSGTEFDGVYWGANPLWTNTYGQYDNGVNVFNNYWNFAGTTLPSGWQELTSNGDTYTVNNGITFNNTGNSNYVSIGTTSAVAPPGFLEMYISSGSDARPTIELSTSDTQISSGAPVYMYENGYGMAYGMYSGNMQFEILTSSYSGSDNAKTAYNAPLIVGIAWPSTGLQLLETYKPGYTNLQTVSETNTANTIASSLYIMIGQASAGSATNIGSFTVSWLRTRVYPPNGTDPVLTSIVLLVGSYSSASIPVPEWNVLSGKPYVTVSAKGISNGLSNILNDGADFGPDTLLGTSSPNQYGPPYTQTSGIQEAFDYAIPLGFKVMLVGDFNAKFYIDVPLVLRSTYLHAVIEGTGGDGETQIQCSSNFTGNYMLSIELQGILRLRGIRWTPQLPDGTMINYGFSYNVGNNPYNSWYLDFIFDTPAIAHLYQANYVNGRMFFKNVQFNGGGQYFFYTTYANSLWQFSQCEIANPFYSIPTSGGSQLMFDECQSLYMHSLNSSPNMQNTDIWIANSDMIFAGTAQIGNNVNIWATNGRYSQYAAANSINIQGTNVYIMLRGGYGNYVGGGSGNFYFITSASGSTGLAILEKIHFENLSSGTSYYLTNSSQIQVISRNNYSGGSPYPISLVGNNITTLPANPPVSGTVYQNTNPYDIRIYLPAYATTSGTAGSVAIALGSSSSPSTIGTKFINGSTSSSATEIIELVVPAGWYYEFTSTGVTFGTATVLPA
ncbi:MAG: hypothetical protein QW478_14485 [Candidatus Micrarchaeaceae archaeon]